MTALLGLLAIAGYQNRDKIAETLRRLGQSTPEAGGQGGIGGLLSQLSTSLGGVSAGGILSGGLGELVDRFKQSGRMCVRRYGGGDQQKNNRRKFGVNFSSFPTPAMALGSIRSA